MTELRLFNIASVSAPAAADSALLDWVSTEAARDYSGPCPIRHYHALYSAATRLCNPDLEKKPFPLIIAEKLTAAFNAMFRTMEANMVVEATTDELRRELRAMRDRRPRLPGDEWYETLVKRSWIEEELRERAIVAQMNA